MSGVPGQPLPGWAPELKPCGTPAAYRRHLRRGEPVDEACQQANTRAWQDRQAAGYVRPSRRPVRVHQAALSGVAKCGRREVVVTDDPGLVTCLLCREGYRYLPPVQQDGAWYRAA